MFSICISSVFISFFFSLAACRLQGIIIKISSKDTYQLILPLSDVWISSLFFLAFERDYSSSFVHANASRESTNQPTQKDAWERHFKNKRQTYLMSSFISTWTQADSLIIFQEYLYLYAFNVHNMFWIKIGIFKGKKEGCLSFKVNNEKLNSSSNLCFDLRNCVEVGYRRARKCL